MLALDERCLGGLWTKSGYQKELESDCSDLFVLVGAATPSPIRRRLDADSSNGAKDAIDSKNIDPQTDIALLGMGCLWAILEEAHITTLAVESAWQRRKLGSLLLSHLLQSGDRRGLTRATLEVRASNQKALNLYQAFGFKPAGTRKRYYSDGEDACILWCSGLHEEEMRARVAQHKERAIAYLESQHQQKFIFTDTDRFD